MSVERMDQYQRNQIETASPEQILLMLYDGAIRFLRRAQAGFEKDDITEMRYGVNKTLAIITEFANTLDHEAGGKIAEDLDALYAFMIRELNAVTVEPEMKKLTDVELLLLDLRDTWGAAVEQNNQDLKAGKGIHIPKAGTKGTTKPSIASTPRPGTYGNVGMTAYGSMAKKAPAAAAKAQATTAANYGSTGKAPESYRPLSVSR